MVGEEVRIGMNPTVDVEIGARVDFERVIVEDGIVPGRDLLFLENALNLRHDAASYCGKSYICGSKIIVCRVPILRLPNGRDRDCVRGHGLFFGIKRQ